MAPSFSPNGKRLKKDFETEARAKTYIGQLKAHAAHPVSLLPEQTREAHSAYSRLPEGLTLAAAVDRGIASWLREHTGRTFSAVLDQVITAKRTSGVTERHLRDVRQKAGRFGATVGERPIASIERAEIREWLANLHVEMASDGYRPKNIGSPLTAESRNCYRRALGLVFGFAVKEGYIPNNPVAAVETAKVISAPVEILTIDEARRLLAAAHAHRFNHEGSPSELSSILPAVAIGLFAGLRPEETLRLDWKRDFDWEHLQIEVAAERTKTARHRYVPINQTLAAWLAIYRDRGAEGKVSPATLWRTLGKVRAKAGVRVGDWPQDVLRHSFASYTLALEPDAARLAGIMGNSVEVIHDHYRRPVRQEQAQDFFAIRP